MDKLGAIEADILISIAELASVKSAGDEDLILMNGNSLIELRKKKNLHTGDQYRCFTMCAVS